MRPVWRIVIAAAAVLSGAAGMPASAQNSAAPRPRRRRRTAPAKRSDRRSCAISRSTGRSPAAPLSSRRPLLPRCGGRSPRQPRPPPALLAPSPTSARPSAPAAAPSAAPAGSQGSGSNLPAPQSGSVLPPAVTSGPCAGLSRTGAGRWRGLGFVAAGLVSRFAGGAGRCRFLFPSCCAPARSLPEAWRMMTSPSHAAPPAVAPPRPAPPPTPPVPERQSARNGGLQPAPPVARLRLRAGTGDRRRRKGDGRIRPRHPQHRRHPGPRYLGRGGDGQRGPGAGPADRAVLPATRPRPGRGSTQSRLSRASRSAAASRFAATSCSRSKSTAGRCSCR